MKKKIIISGIISVVLIGIIIGLIMSKPEEENLVDEVQIKKIVELATLKTVYTNVVMDVIPAGEGFEHIGEVDRTVWVEYQGYANIGIDMKKVKIEVERKKVTVFMPKAEILSIGIHNVDDAKIIKTKDSWLNKNKISSTKQLDLINDGQIQMRKDIEKNEDLFEEAEERAKELIENHIKQMGKLVDKEYEIKWVTS